GRVVGTVAVTSLRKGTVRDTELKDFRVQRFVLVVGGAIHRKDQRLSIGSPRGVGASKPARTRAVGKFPGGQLARSSSVGSNHENLRIPGFKITRSVEAIDQVFINLRRIRPLRALRCRGKRGYFRRSRRNERAER